MGMGFKMSRKIDDEVITFKTSKPIRLQIKKWDDGTSTIDIEILVPPSVIKKIGRLDVKQLRESVRGQIVAGCQDTRGNWITIGITHLKR